MMGLKKKVRKDKDQDAMPSKKFQRKQGFPLYLQIKEHLLSRIESAVWGEGEMIPTEGELCEYYGVSKITVKEAVKLLVKDGKLYRIPGKGTFVTKPKLEQKLNRFFSFTRWAKQNDLDVASRLLKVKSYPCNLHIANHLGIEEDDPVTQIERLRLANNEPLVLEFIWVPAKLCADLHLKDLANISLNDILWKDYGISLHRAVESIEPKAAEEYDAKLLGIKEQSLLLHVEHTAFDTKNRIVYFVSSIYRGDRVKFSIELSAT